MCYWAQQAVELCEAIDDSSLAEHIAPVQAAMAALRRDRRIVFIGGKGCGKTSLLAAVTGCSVMAKAPWSGAYVCWRYRCDDGDATCSRFVPEESLEGLELVDTAPCESAAETVASLLPGADVVVAVMDARSPEASPVWPILAALGEGTVGTVLLALTHSDTLSAEAVVNLGPSIRELCRERLGSMPAACSVSPNNAAAVETFSMRVQEALAAPGGVRAGIRRVQQEAENLIYKQGSVLKSREDVMRMDSGFLAGIEQEIENFQTRQRQGVKGHCETFTDAVRRVRPRLLRRLRSAYGILFSPITLLRLELFGAGVEGAYCHMVQEDVLHLQEESDRAFILSCAAHWKSVRPRMKQTLECEIGDFPEEDLAVDLGKLRARLKHDLCEPFMQVRVRRELAEQFREPAGWMRALVMLLCLLLVTAGVLGFLGMNHSACYTVAAAALLWGCGSIGHYLSLRRMCRAVSAVSERLCARMQSHLAEVVEQLIVSRVSAYRRLYTAPRRKVAEHEATLQPLQQRHSEILRLIRSVAPRL